MYAKFDKILQEKGITRYKVAKDTGISQSALSDWKSGKSKPKTDKLLKIAEYFGVDIKDLV